MSKKLLLNFVLIAALVFALTGCKGCTTKCNERKDHPVIRCGCFFCRQ